MKQNYAAMLIIAVSLAGCMHVRVDEAPPSIETLKLLRASGFPPVGLGSFVEKPDGKSLARSINIRGSTMRPVKGKSFADDLRMAFEGELRTAGKLDLSSPIELSATLTENGAREDMANGSATLGVTITVRRNGLEVFTKPYRVEAKWKSEFIGALAIPEAFRQYNALYPILVRQVLSDPALVDLLKAR